MYDLKQSTAITIPIFAHDANGDAVTGLTDGGFTKRISKNGGSFAAMTVTITEKEGGWYDLPLTTSHSDTTGILTMYFTHASCKQINLQFRVKARLTDDIPTAAQIQAEIEEDSASILDTLQDRLTAARAGYLDKLNVSGTLAHSDSASTYKADVSALAIEANVETHVTNSLNSYDPPTKTEMDSGFAGLNNLSSADVQTIIETNKLDHLVAVAESDDPVDNSIIAKLAASDGDWSGFSNATDSLEAMRDQGDAAWQTATTVDLNADQSGVTIGTVSTLTGHTAQTGDSYAQVTSGTYGLSVIEGLVDDLEARLTAARAGYLDKLNVTGTLAHSDAASTYKADVSALAIEANVETHVTNSLNSYDPPTRAELTTDKNSIITEIDANEAKIDTMQGNVTDILADTNELQGLISASKIAAQVKGIDDIDLSATMKASVNAEVLDVLNVDTFAEPGQEAPLSTTTLVKKIGYLYKFLRNKATTTSTTITIYNDDGTTSGQESTISDDGSTFTRGEFGSGS